MNKQSIPTTESTSDHNAPRELKFLPITKRYTSLGGLKEVNKHRSTPSLSNVIGRMAIKSGTEEGRNKYTESTSDHNAPKELKFLPITKRYTSLGGLKEVNKHRSNKEKSAHLGSANRRRGKKILALLSLTGVLTIGPWIKSVENNPKPKTKPAVAAEAIPFSPTTDIEHSVESTSTTPTTGEDTTPTAEKPLEIVPPKNFLTPEGLFIKEDFHVSIPAIDADILAFVRPESELDNIGEFGQTVIDTVLPAERPTRLTPQVEEYKLQNSNFTPTAERTQRSNGDMWYWGNQTAGNFQKTAVLSNETSIYPGQLGNAVFWMHGSTKTAGGGDLPALEKGDTLNLSRNVDGNSYKFEYIERELIEVDQSGGLTDAEKMRQINKGYGQDVSAGEVVHRYLKGGDTPTISIVICSDKEGTPGGVSGRGAADARVIYRFKLVDSDIKLKYPN